jgi:hypothetical protein
MMMMCVLEQHVKLDFYNGSSLKQQSVGRHVSQLRHILGLVLLHKLELSVMVNVLVSIAVDYGFEMTGQTKNYKIGIGCFSAKL